MLQQKNIGLYGHVVRANQNYQRGKIQQEDDTYTYYKIEYWQFFGYNRVGVPGDFGDQEGDWATVQLLYDPQNNN